MRGSACSEAILGNDFFLFPSNHRNGGMLRRQFEVELRAGGDVLEFDRAIVGGVRNEYINNGIAKRGWKGKRAGRPRIQRAKHRPYVCLVRNIEIKIGGRLRILRKFD